MSYHITRKTEETDSATEYKQNKSRYAPNEQGYYGKFGGAYIPEMLHRNVEELRTRYLDIINEAYFQK
jgi:tryptophan synthase beta chain